MQDVAAAPGEDRSAELFALMLPVFFGGGLLASVEALLVPQLKLMLGLGYAKALLIQLTYYAGYLLFAPPATMLMARIGTARAIVIGLLTMAAGCLAIVLAQVSLRFPPLLGALLLLSSGVTVLQIACNGVMATVGKRGRAVARFTLLQGFNALGTVIGPLGGAWLLLRGGAGGLSLVPFLAFAIGFGIVALLFARNAAVLPAAREGAPTLARLRSLLGEAQVMRGTLAIFVYVGAEVTIGTLAVSYLMLPQTLALQPVAAGRLVSLYWAGAMVGRFAGAWILRRVAAPRLLGIASATAIGLIAIAVLLPRSGGAVALLAVGLCNSIMFPTIYGLAMPSRSADMPVTAMLLCMAVCGGAVVPIATGLLADHLSLTLSLLLPAACYGVILSFARRTAETGVSAA